MKTKTIVIAAIAAAFVFVIIGAVVLYNVLSDVAPSEPSLTQVTGEDDDDRVIAPDFMVTDFFGDEMRLTDLFGRPIVLNFWASWSQSCVAQMPDFDRLYRELGGDVEFVMVSLVDGERETRASAEEYIRDNGYSFPVYFDEAQIAATVFNVSSIPVTFFIDREGYVEAYSPGELDEETLRLGISYIIE